MGFDPCRQFRLPAVRAAARRRYDRLFVAASFVAVAVLVMWAFLGGS